MSPRVIILFSADEALQHAAIDATVGTRRVLRLATTATEALSMLLDDLNDVDLIILDLDSNICGVMLLNALGFCCERIPVITVTSFEREYALPHVISKGAAACLGKPVTADAIADLIELMSGSASLDPRYHRHLTSV